MQSYTRSAAPTETFPTIEKEVIPMKRTMKMTIAILATLAILLTCASCAFKKEVQTETAAPVSGEAETLSAEPTVTVDAAGSTVITLNGTTASVSGSGAQTDGSTVLIKEGGTYTVTGTLTDGRIVVDADDADVTILLSDANITCSDSSALYVYRAKTATVYAAQGTENTLTDGKAYAYTDPYSSEADEEPNACLYSKADLILAGSGSLTVNGNAGNGVTGKDTLQVETLTLTVSAAGNGVTGKDSLTVKDANVTVKAGTDGSNEGGKGFKSDGDVTLGGGTISLDCTDDGVHAEENVTITDGKLTIESGDDCIHAENTVTVEGGALSLDGHEGLEGTLVTIDGGTISIKASDDGINAAKQVDGITPTVTINGGELTIEMGQGDTDGVDANGDIIINGGTIRVTAQSPFDYDGKGELNGGTVYVNGEQVTELTNQFGGGMGGGMMGGRPGGFGGQDGSDKPDGSERPEGFSRPDGFNEQDGSFPSGGRGKGRSDASGSGQNA